MIFRVCVFARDTRPYAEHADEAQVIVAASRSSRVVFFLRLFQARAAAPVSTERRLDVARVDVAAA